MLQGSETKVQDTSTACIANRGKVESCLRWTDNSPGTSTAHIANRGKVENCLHSAKRTGADAARKGDMKSSFHFPPISNGGDVAARGDVTRGGDERRRYRISIASPYANTRSALP